MDKPAIIEMARARMSEAIDADQYNREEALDDLQNLAGRQYPEKVRIAREKEGKPCFVINQLPQFARQVTGDIRRLNPAIKVLAADSAAKQETAEIYKGLIRHIEARSNGSDVYEGSAESAAQCGMGAFRIRAEYEDESSFNQEILIERIHNPFAVYWDPQAHDVTRSDAMFCFVTDQMKGDDFKRDYPDASPMDAEHDGITDGLEHWHSNGSVVVAEYFWKEPEDVKLALLRNGQVVEGKQIVAGLDIVKQRTTRRHKVMWAKISGRDVLEGPTEMPCKHLPVVAVIGEEMHVGEEIVRTSVVRFAKDPQRIYNYASSAEAELVALQPKAPYIGTINQFTGVEKFWNEANSANRPYLPYVPDPKAPGAPQRQQPPVASQGLSNMIARASNDMQATTGIYNAALGARSNETSGVAIRQRQMESDLGNSVYSDNLAKSIAQCGRILVDMIPRIYDTNRMVRIVGDDDEEKLVEINGMGFDLVEGAQPVNDLTHGRYDVRVTVGPNYTTMRQEVQEGMTQFLQAYPAAAPLIGDLYAKAQDWPEADKIAERLKKMLPPGMIDMSDMSPEEQQAAQQAQQAQMQQAQQQEQMRQAMMQMQMRKLAADAGKAEASIMTAQADVSQTMAQADKTALEAAQIQFELALQSGLFNEAIQMAVARALQGQMQQPTGQF